MQYLQELACAGSIQPFLFNGHKHNAIQLTIRAHIHLPIITTKTFYWLTCMSMYKWAIGWSCHIRQCITINTFDSPQQEWFLNMSDDHGPSWTTHSMVQSRNVSRRHLFMPCNLGQHYNADYNALFIVTQKLAHPYLQRSTWPMATKESLYPQLQHSVEQ